MYLHARGQAETTLSRADWRVIAYRDIQRLVKTTGNAMDLSVPAWLKQEVVKFTPVKWLTYWNRRTGRKLEKIVKSGPKGPVRKTKGKAITGNKNLVTLSKRELRKRKKAR